MNTEMQIRDFSHCWVFDRLIIDDVFPVMKAQEIEFDWHTDFGMYQDFRSLNQQLPGYTAISFCFVATRNFILC